MLERHGISTAARFHWNLKTAPLVEHAVRRGEGLLAKDGRWSCGPDATPAAARRTSSSSRTR
jgi:hypothetical protein